MSGRKVDRKQGGREQDKNTQKEQQVARDLLELGEIMSHKLDKIHGDLVLPIKQASQVWQDIQLVNYFRQEKRMCMDLGCR